VSRLKAAPPKAVVAEDAALAVPAVVPVGAGRQNAD